MISKVPEFLVAGTHSGVGKTTVAFTLMALLAEKGFVVQPFKIGPDFIDGGYHRLATGRDSINLDLWMMGWKGIRESHGNYASQADVSIIEGMGALYDGKDGTGEGSSADIAKRLKIPIVLVLDIWGMTRSTAAVLKGFFSFDRGIRVAGVILNRAGSRGHFEMVVRGLSAELKKKVLGYLPSSSEWNVPERHLGLKTLEENEHARKMKRAVLKTASQTIDVSKLIRVFKIQKKKKRQPERVPIGVHHIRIGIARDAAFCFYYVENLKMLEAAGAQLVPFSPLKSKTLPKEISGLYLGGGYPESFPQELATNKNLRLGILKKVKEGLPVYAECGGLMYLSRDLTNFEDKAFPMVSVFPLKVKMDRKFLAIRYVKVKTTEDGLLGPKGTMARGQEFHQSRIIADAFKGQRPYQITTSTGQTFKEGWASANALGSYIHLHFKSNPSIPSAFVQKCASYKKITS